MCLPVLQRLESKTDVPDSPADFDSDNPMQDEKCGRKWGRGCIWRLLLFLLAGPMGTGFFFSCVLVSRCFVDGKRQNEGHIISVYADPLGMVRLQGHHLQQLTSSSQLRQCSWSESQEHSQIPVLSGCGRGASVLGGFVSWCYQAYLLL